VFEFVDLDPVDANRIADSITSMSTPVTNEEIAISEPRARPDLWLIALVGLGLVVMLWWPQAGAAIISAAIIYYLIGSRARRKRERAGGPIP
jgi:hypothetical protein